MSGTPPTRVLARIDTADVLEAGRRNTALALWDTGRVEALLLTRSGPATADASAAAAFLAAVRPGIRLVLDADPAHDYPYNLARRVASLQALDGRSPGLLLPAAAGAAITPLQLLWQSWPRDSILGDRRTRTFVDVTRLRRVDARGVHPVAGPLQTPVDQLDLPVVLQRVDSASEPAPEADVLVTDDAHARRAQAVAMGRPVFVETKAGELAEALAGSPDGVVVSGDPHAIIRAVRDLRALPPRGADGLRARWLLPSPRPVLHGTPAFAPTGSAEA